MVKRDYIPAHKSELKFWAEQFLDVVKQAGAESGISEEQTLFLKSCVEKYDADLITEKHLIDQKHAQVAKTRTDRKVLKDCCRSLSKIIKAHPGYEDKVGTKFDIIGAEVSFDQNTFSPKIKLKRVSGGVKISFVKYQTEGVNIYRREEGTSEDFAFLARVSKSPYLDTNEMDNHNTYEYMARALIKDKEIGKESGVAKRTV